MSDPNPKDPYQALSDEQLMKRFQQDDQRAFDHLFFRFEPRLQRFLDGYTRNPEDTRDLIQETFLRVYRARRSYCDVARFSTWIFTIAINQARSQHRRNLRRDAVHLSGGTLWDGEHHELETLDPDLLQDEQMQLRMQLDCTVANLERLSEEYRTAIVLRDYLHLSYAEIVKRTGLALGTVKSRISRGRRMLQEGIQQMERDSRTAAVRDS